MSIKVSHTVKAGSSTVTVTVKVDDGFPPDVQGKQARSILENLLDPQRTRDAAASTSEYVRFKPGV